jgi:hypothetical protein
VAGRRRIGGVAPGELFMTWLTAAAIALMVIVVIAAIGATVRSWIRS